MDESSEQLNNQIFSWLSHLSNLDPTSPQLDNLDGSWEVESIYPSSGEEDFDMLQPNPNNTSELQLLLAQHRFEDLLKERLQSERAGHLPLFPWETEITEINEYVADKEEKPQSSWQMQLNNLSISIPVPENILASIFTECSEFRVNTFFTTPRDKNCLSGKLFISRPVSCFKSSSGKTTHVSKSFPTRNIREG